MNVGATEVFQERLARIRQEIAAQDPSLTDLDDAASRHAQAIGLLAHARWDKQRAEESLAEASKYEAQKEKECEAARAALMAAAETTGNLKRRSNGV